MRRFVLCLLLSGCSTTGRPIDSHPPPQVGEPAPKLEDGSAESAYQDVLKQYSQQAELYAGTMGGEDTRMFCAATFQSGPYREARVRRTGAFRAEPAAEIDQKIAAEKAEADQFDEFFFAAHLVDYRFDDFDKHHSVWRIALVGDGVEETPVLVERVGRATVDMRAIYPYLGDFWAGYRIKFPKLAQGRGAQLKLRLASTLGKVELTFPAN